MSCTFNTVDHQQYQYIKSFFHRVYDPFPIPIPTQNPNPIPTFPGVCRRKLMNAALQMKAKTLLDFKNNC